MSSTENINFPIFIEDTLEDTAMIQLALTQEESVILREVLDNYLSDLRQEISATDLVEFKEILKARKNVIIKVLDTLSETAQ